MISSAKFLKLPLQEKFKLLCKEGSYIMSIRYYQHKVSLYMLNNYYVEVFYNHRHWGIDKIELLDHNHSRMKFYSDQITLPRDLL